jgi:hypothetical protein
MKPQELGLLVVKVFKCEGHIKHEELDSVMQ